MHNLKFMRKNLFYSAFLLVVVSTAFLSCSKDEAGGTSDGENEKEEVTLLGSWTSYCYDELGEFGELVGRENSSDYSIVFTETEATFNLSDLPENATSTYDFKEGDESIIYLTSAFEDYDMQMVVQMVDGQLVLYQTSPYWDFAFQYYFTKDK